MLAPYRPVKVTPTASHSRRKPIKAPARMQKKSRTGCKNCKLRSVKCDESHPQCRRCIAYGVLCNYEQQCNDLQVIVEGMAKTIVMVPNPALGMSLWSNQDDKLLHKFRARTAMTISTGQRLLLFQGEVVRFSVDNSFLKHAVCALTLMHDRHLEYGHSTSLSKAEAYHWYLATAIFNQELFRATTIRLNIEKQVSLWCTASLLGQLTFCHIEAQSPEEAWPLTNNPKTDLNWLKMSNGKFEVVKLADDIFSHPCYRDLYHTPLSDLDPRPPSVLPVPDHSLDQFDESGYRAKADDLRGILGSHCLVTVVLTFWNSVHNTTSFFRDQLEQKDPIALALLLLWFTKLHQLPIWWLKRRTLFEGRAICMYLETYHATDTKLQLLCSWPREVLFASSSR